MWRGGKGDRGWSLAMRPLVFLTLFPGSDAKTWAFKACSLVDYGHVFWTIQPAQEATAELHILLSSALETMCKQLDLLVEGVGFAIVLGSMSFGVVGEHFFYWWPWPNVRL